MSPPAIEGRSPRLRVRALRSAMAHRTVRDGVEDVFAVGYYRGVGRRHDRRAGHRRIVPVPGRADPRVGHAAQRPDHSHDHHRHDSEPLEESPHAGENEHDRGAVTLGREEWRRRRSQTREIVALAGLVALAPAMTAHADPYGDAATAASAALVAKHGEAERAASSAASTRCGALGARTTAMRPRSARSSKPSSCRRGEALDAVFARLEFAFERIDGYFIALGRDLRRGLDLAIGPELPLDERLGAWSIPARTVAEDLFQTQVAFVALLNFPLTTLERAAARGRRLDAAAVGGGAARAALRHRACRPRRNARLAAGLTAGRGLHRRLQHLHAPPAHRGRPAPVPGRSCA